MPELPEVETHVRELADLLPGHRIRHVAVSWPRTVAEPDPDTFCAQLAGHTFQALSRRAKYMLFGLDEGWTLLLHLRMTGTLRMVPAGTAPGKHVHVVFVLDQDRELHFRDQRKFGRMWLVQDPETLLAGLGPEPLSRQFTGRFLATALARRSAPIKAVLLDQAVAAGVGNIYADEALFDARIHPRRPANQLAAQDCVRLCRSIRKMLRHGIAYRGSFIGTYAPPSGIPGQFQAEHKVFRRTGEPCLRCGTDIERITVAQRSTHFCARCQPA